MKSLLFCHIPKAGGTTIRTWLKKTKLGTCKGHYPISKQIVKKDEVTFAVVRNPFTWYGSLYYYFKKKKDQHICKALSSLSYDEFLQVMLHKKHFVTFVEQKKITVNSFTYKHLAEWMLGYKDVAADVSFYTYTILFMLFDKKCLNQKNIEDITMKDTLIDHILHLETLDQDLQKVLTSIKTTKKFPHSSHLNRSSNVITENNSPFQEEIRQQDKLVFKLFY